MSQIVPFQQKVMTVRSLLERALPQIQLALPKHLTGERMLRIVMTSVQKNPKLAEADPRSLIGAVIQSAQLGLEPDGALGEAYLVPFKSRGVYQVQLIPGYRGLMKLARNSGMVTNITADVVRKRDVFRYSKGLEDEVVHQPFSPDVPDDADDVAQNEGAADIAKIAGPMTHAYAKARFKDGEVQCVVVTRMEVLAIRERSSGWRAYKSGQIRDNPWATDPAAMWCKTAVKRLAKFLPQSVELAQALSLDNEAEQGLPQDFGAVVSIDAPESEQEEQQPETPPKTTADLARASKAKKQQQAPASGDSYVDTSQLDEQPPPPPEDA